MPKYAAPNSDISRLYFMNRAITTANAIPLGEEKHINDATLSDLTAHYALYRAAYDNTSEALGKRKVETAESAAAMARLQLFMSHMWTDVYNRAQRDDLSVRLLEYYRLGNDGSRPTPSKRDEWLEVGQSLIVGDAKAVVAGYPPAISPSAAELQVVYEAAVAEAADVQPADIAYDKAQAAVATFRPRADALIKRARADILYATYDMDAASQRRLLRNYGASFRYLPGETVDDGDETAVGGEGVG